MVAGGLIARSMVGSGCLRAVVTNRIRRNRQLRLRRSSQCLRLKLCVLAATRAVSTGGTLSPAGGRLVPCGTILIRGTTDPERSLYFALLGLRGLQRLAQTAPMHSTVKRLR
jgi:hypothetical protein